MAVPARERTLSTRARVDYADAFVVALPGAGERPAADWMRAMVEDVPQSTRRALRAGWGVLCLRLRPGEPGRVMGWEVRRREPDLVLLAARSPLGLDAEVLVRRRSESLLFATFVTLRGPVARGLWLVMSNGHRRAVRYLLDRVAREHAR